MQRWGVCSPEILVLRKLGFGGGTLVVTGEMLGMLPEKVELQPEISARYFSKQWGCSEYFCGQRICIYIWTHSHVYGENNERCDDNALLSL